MYFPKPSLNENDLAIIERGATADHSIEAGQYVSWHGRTGKAKAAILQGTTLSDSLFDYDEDGMLNHGLEWSTTEKIIGTWIDGRPVYFVAIPIDSAANAAIDVSMYNIDIVLFNSEFMTNVNGRDHVTGSYYISGEDLLAPYLTSDKNTFSLRHGTRYAYGPGYLILAFVKKAS
mgnify:CR=1 FL=1